MTPLESGMLAYATPPIASVAEHATTTTSHLRRRDLCIWRSPLNRACPHLTGQSSSLIWLFEPGQATARREAVELGAAVDVEWLGDTLRGHESPSGLIPHVAEVLLRHDVRLPDERSRLRADQGPPRGARAR